MPAQRKIDKASILSTALGLVRQNGIEALNVRAIASALSCSTQPIYHSFGSMGELRNALKSEAANVHSDIVEQLLASNKYGKYETYGMAFLFFAKKETKLFEFLYLNGENTENRMDVNIDTIIATIVEEYGYSYDTAKQLHSYMTIFSYGLATLLINYVERFSLEEILQMLEKEFYALTHIFGEPPKGYKLI